jgi:hypothetical protein
MGEKIQLQVQNTTDLISMLATDISISSQIYVTVFIEKRQYYNNVSYEPRRVQKGAKCSRNETHDPDTNSNAVLTTPDVHSSPKNGTREK